MTRDQCLNVSGLPEELRMEVVRAFRQNADPDGLEALAIELDEIGHGDLGNRLRVKAASLRGMSI